MARWILRFRFLVIAVVLGLTAFFATQLPKLRLDPDTEAYVPKGHEIRVFWDEAKDRFGTGRDILVAVQADGPDGIFTPAMLAKIAELTEGIKDLDGVVAEDVASLSDAEAMVGTEEGLDVEPFFDDPPTTMAEARAVRDRVYANPVYLDRLVSRDGSIAAIIVRAQHTYGASATELYRRIAEYTDSVEVPGGRVLIAGNPAVEYVYGRQMAADLSRLIPMALVVVILILFLCFRSISLGMLLARAAGFAVLVGGWQLWNGNALSGSTALLAITAAMLTVRGAFLPAFVVAVAVVWTWGLQAMLGLPVYIAGTLVPPLLLAIGCADGIHFLERYFDKAAELDDRDAVIEQTFAELWRPIVLTSVTTAAGFGSLTIGHMAVYQVFGSTTAFGITVAMIVTLTFLPATLACLPLPAASARASRRSWVPASLMRMAEGIEGHRRLVMGTGIVATVLLAVCALDLRVDYSWVESLAPGTPVLQAERILRTKHGGTMPLNIIVRAPEPDGIKDPALLRAIDATLESLAEHPQVGDTRSIAEYVKRMNQAMNEDRPEAFRIPDSRELVAQYLLLYSMSGDPTEYDDMVDYDYQAANLAVLLRTDRMVVMDEVIARAEQLLDQNVRPLGATATATGSAVIQKTVLDMILDSQIYSLASAALFVTVFMWILFRSLRDALICMIPALFTGVANFGGMALFGIPLGPDKAMISAIALGIGIDYSIHLMSCFRDEVVDGSTIYQAIVESMRTTGRAILFNALVVVAGFLVLAFSQSPSNATFGAMIAANMAVACVAALTLLPAALTILGYVQTSRAMHTPVRIGGKLVSPTTATAMALADPSELGPTTRRSEADHATRSATGRMNGTALESRASREPVETRSLPR